MYSMQLQLLGALLERSDWECILKRAVPVKNVAYVDLKQIRIVLVFSSLTKEINTFILVPS